MPVRMICPNRSCHPGHKQIDSRRDENEFKKYKVLYRSGKRPIRFLPEDVMVRLYYNTKDRYSRLAFWYCSICGCVVHESFVEVSYPPEDNLKQMVFLRPPVVNGTETREDSNNI